MRGRPNISSSPQSPVVLSFSVILKLFVVRRPNESTLTSAFISELIYTDCLGPVTKRKQLFPIKRPS